MQGLYCLEWCPAVVAPRSASLVRGDAGTHHLLVQHIIHAQEVYTNTSAAGVPSPQDDAAATELREERCLLPADQKIYGEHPQEHTVVRAGFAIMLVAPDWCPSMAMAMICSLAQCFPLARGRWECASHLGLGRRCFRHPSWSPTEGGNVDPLAKRKRPSWKEAAVVDPPRPPRPPRAPRAPRRPGRPSGLQQHHPTGNHKH